MRNPVATLLAVGLVALLFAAVVPPAGATGGSAHVRVLLGGGPAPSPIISYCDPTLACSLRDDFGYDGLTAAALTIRHLLPGPPPQPLSHEGHAFECASPASQVPPTSLSLYWDANNDGSIVPLLDGSVGPALPLTGTLPTLGSLDYVVVVAHDGVDVQIECRF